MLRKYFYLTPKPITTTTWKAVSYTHLKIFDIVLARLQLEVDVESTNAETIASVSYTHLDVYKRQHLDPLV